MNDTIRQQHRLVEALDLTGSWATVTKTYLTSRSSIPPGCWFLGWSRFAIIWADLVPRHVAAREVHWVSAHHLEPVHGDAPISGVRWVTVFRSMQEFPHRQALLHQVGFDVWNGPFGLMELMPTQVGWRWNE